MDSSSPSEISQGFGRVPHHQDDTTVVSSELFHSRGPSIYFSSHCRMSKELSLLEAAKAMADCRSGTWQPQGSCVNWE